MARRKVYETSALSNNLSVIRRAEQGTEYTSRYIPNDHEGIVSRELWDKVQDVLATPKDHTTFPNKNSHPLRGKLICGECGEKFYRMTRGAKEKKYAVWGCTTKKQKGTKGCGNGYIREEIILMALAEMTGEENVEIAVEMVDSIQVFNDRSIVIELGE